MSESDNNKSYKNNNYYSSDVIYRENYDLNDDRLVIKIITKDN